VSQPEQSALMPCGLPQLTVLPAGIQGKSRWSRGSSGASGLMSYFLGQIEEPAPTEERRCRGRCKETHGAFLLP
jgi:hypothetical protein